jgi:cytochrome c nitrite reductase small subunit
VSEADFGEKARAARRAARRWQPRPAAHLLRSNGMPAQPWRWGFRFEAAERGWPKPCLIGLKGEMGMGEMKGRGWLLRSMFPRAPGSRLPVFFAIALGIAAGVGSYTFSYAKGLSYFGTEPSACVNCHIMEPQYAAWQKASHHTVARCIDCHLPAAFVPKYIAKAENGYRHGKLFTTQTFEEPITVKPPGLAILQDNCERCHADLVHGIVGYGAFDPPGADDRAAAAPDRSIPCIHCHWTVGHGERAGLGGPLREGRGAAPEASETDVGSR